MDEPKRTYVTTKEVLLQVQEFLVQVVKVLGTSDLTYTYSRAREAKALLDAELKRWEVPQTSPFGRLIAPVPVEEDE